MKFFLSQLVLAASASAFAPSAFTRPSTLLHNARVDSAEAIADALAASKEFGPTSKEARVAWDIVEEMDASDNSGAYEPVAPASDYEEKVAALSSILSEQQEKVQSIKTLVSEIKNIKLAPAGASSAPDSVAMKKALDEAKAAVEEFGADSSEAKLAWETVEEVASSNNSAATIPGLDEECLVETLEACEALDEITRVVNLATTSSDINS
mmetsp:Transcript_24551/g.36010  ORF Transcript_24551/g.36010 Transcript_24551/m.36010 type:complete len:210 (+) Transcript_24551:58-687(+)|eukprot:CAMPEP_0195516256 /NCGR_PEP_ID=MMETSP0794_2-20130614/7036_1 /TAXON_ID=515487 /ORGANISM="Stephanopyxis turris, Strain CCMP 815" /LENGTH=209 /DNA_ID=CAMNT_0040644809 /DNA_START=26 /DNA_END=655 /DNA_ORIENTATION=-